MESGHKLASRKPEVLDHDIAHNIDLAVEVASGKRTFSDECQSRAKNLQVFTLQKLYAFDAAQYLYLVDQAIIDKEDHLHSKALNLMEHADPDQVRPTLQHAVVAGVAPVAVQAARQLLQAAWDGRQDYALSLLAHRSKPVRGVAIEWLLPQGETLIDQISPLLADKSVNTRLMVVQMLARLGGERAHALLADQRVVEKSISVKQAIVDTIGLPEPPADLDPFTAIASLLAEAARDGKKSPLCWYAADEPTGLRWVNGEDVPASVIYYLLTCQMRMKQMRIDLNVCRALQWLDRRTTGALALTLFTGWAEEGAKG